MKLRAVYNTADEIPEVFRELYTEVKGKYELTEVEGIKTIEDVKRVTEALNKERNEHKATKEKYVAPWGDRDPAVEIPKLDLIPELEAKAKDGKLDETKIESIVTARINAVKTPLEQQLKRLKDDYEAALAQVRNYETKEKTRMIHDTVREIAAKANVLKEAYATPDSALLMLAERQLEVNSEGAVVTKEGGGVLAGLLPDVWINEVLEKHTYLRPFSAGGGAGGSGAGGHVGKNPFSRENWNVTEQGKLYRENPTKAEQLMKAAGCPRLGVMPPEKK